MSQLERAQSIAEATYGVVHPLAFAAVQAIANLKAENESGGGRLPISPLSTRTCCTGIGCR